MKIHLKHVLAITITSAVTLSASAAGGFTPLMEAARRGDVKGIERQLAAGANINATSKQTLEGVQYEALADEGTGNFAVDRSIVDKLGHHTALMLAAKGEHWEAVQRLLDAGADVNAGGGVYCEPETELDSCVLIPKTIGWATLAGRADMVELLLKKGAKARDGLIGAAAAGGQTGIVRLLLEHKAPADIGLKPAAANGQTEAVRMLLDAGAKIDSQEGDLCGKTALIHAAERGHTETVRLLLARGADKAINSYIDELGACDGDGTALDYATRKGHKQTVSVLKGEEAPTASAEPAPSAEATTPAKSKSLIEAIRSALKPSSSAKAHPDSSASHPLLAAAKSKVAAGVDAKELHETLSSAIFDDCADMEYCECVARSYAPAAAEDRLETVRFLLDNGVDVNQSPDADDQYYGYPLYKALELLGQVNFSCGYEDTGVNTQDNIATVSDGISKIATLLVSKGANVKIEGWIDYGSGMRMGTRHASPLGVALENGSDELVRILIEKGANVNDWLSCHEVFDMAAPCKEYGKPLELAAETGKPELVKLLLEKGAKDKKAALKAAKNALKKAESEPQKTQYREVISLLEASSTKKGGAQQRR